MVGSVTLMVALEAGSVAPDGETIGVEELLERQRDLSRRLDALGSELASATDEARVLANKANVILYKLVVRSEGGCDGSSRRV